MKRLTKHTTILVASYGVAVIALATFELFTWLDDAQTSYSKVTATVSFLVVILFGLVQIYPILSHIFNPEHRLSDEEIENALAELSQAKVLFKDKQHKQAVEKATRVIEKLPNKAEAYRVRAQANAALSQYASALEDYDKAIALEPGYPYVHSMRAVVHEEMGNYELAIPDLQTSAALAPDLIEGTLFKLGNLHFLQAKYDEAEKYYKELLQSPKVSEKQKEMALGDMNRIANYRQRHQH